MTLRTRLILWFAGTLSAILLIFCGALTWLQPKVDIATLDEELANDIVTVAGVLSTEAEELGPGTEAVAGMLDELRLPKTWHCRVRSDGRAVGCAVERP